MARRRGFGRIGGASARSGGKNGRARETIIRDPAADTEYSQSKVLTNARQQAIRLQSPDRYLFIVDIDAHHYESDHYHEILEYVDNPILRNEIQLSGLGPGTALRRRWHLPGHGRPHRATLTGREKEKAPAGDHRDTALTSAGWTRWAST